MLFSLREGEGGKWEYLFQCAAAISKMLVTDHIVVYFYSTYWVLQIVYLRLKLKKNTLTENKIFLIIITGS